MDKLASHRIGIDVGGTNTDAVIMRGRDVITWTKRPTTEDVTAGIVAALSDVLAGTGLDRSLVGAVMIGTTHFTNAVVQRRGLTPAAISRLCRSASSSTSVIVFSSR